MRAAEEPASLTKSTNFSALGRFRRGARTCPSLLTTLSAQTDRNLGLQEVGVYMKVLPSFHMRLRYHPLFISY